MWGEGARASAAVGDARLLELVDDELGEALAEALADVGALGREAGQLDHDVAAVEAAELAQGALVVRVEVGELDLAPGVLALARVGGGALALDGPAAQARGRHRLGLDHVDALQQAGEQAAGVAADLVAAQGQVVEAVEHEGEPVGGRDGLEERVEAGLDRVLAQQALGDRLVGADPELLVGARRAPPRSARAGRPPRRACERARGPARGRARRPGRPPSRRARRSCRCPARPRTRTRPAAVLRHPSLGVGQRRLRGRGSGTA